MAPIAPADLDARLRAAVERELPCIMSQCKYGDPGHVVACPAAYRDDILTALAPIIAEAQRDTERLDWLADRMQVETLPPAPVYIVEIPMHDCPDPRDANLRAAIDAAHTPEAGDE